MTDQALDAAITRTVAEKIIGSLDEEHRAAFLTKAVEKALKDYSVKMAIENAVAAKALAVATELLAGGEWSKAIRAAVLEGFGVYIKALPAAVTAGLSEMMHGKDGGDTYSRAPGAILKHLQAARTSE